MNIYANTACLLLAISISSNIAYAGDNVLISHSPMSIYPASGHSVNYGKNISTDGRYIAYASTANDIDFTDTNSFKDVYYYDRQTNSSVLISISSSGEVGNGASENPRISADGRSILFHSYASNLVPDDTNNESDVFLKNMDTGVLSRISTNSAGVEGNGASLRGTLNEDGSLAVYSSVATNLVDNDINAHGDIFLFNTVTGTTRLVSVTQSGVQGNSSSQHPFVSEDGNVIAFQSNATNLIPDDFNGSEVIILDVSSGALSRASVNDQGEQANSGSGLPSLNHDGSLVAFESSASNFATDDLNEVSDVFIRDIAAGTTQLLSRIFDGTPGNDSSHHPILSSDGRSITFFSHATNLISGVMDSNASWDQFVVDIKSGYVELLSKSISAEQTGNFRSFNGAISGDGRYVAFSSQAEDLVLTDTNFDHDMFLHDRGAQVDPLEPENILQLPTDKWLTVSLPCVPVPDTTLGDIFGSSIGGEYQETWAAFKFDPQIGNSGDYVNIGEQGEIASGQGFWIKQITGSDVDVQLPNNCRGGASTLLAPQTCNSEIGCYSTPLSNLPVDIIRWQMIGNPYPASSSIQFDQVVVTTTSGPCSDVDGCTPDEAFENNILFSTFYQFTGDSYSPLTSGSSIDTWGGFWVGGLPGSVGNDTQLHFPE